MHFIASTFFGTLFVSIICSGADFALFWCNLHQNLKTDAITAPSNGAIWNKFSEQHEHQSIKKHHIQSLISTFLQIRCRFNAHFSWVIDYKSRKGQKLYFVF